MPAPTKPTDRARPEPLADALADLYAHLLSKRQARLQADAAAPTHPPKRSYTNSKGGTPRQTP